MEEYFHSTRSNLLNTFMDGASIKYNGISWGLTVTIKAKNFDYTGCSAGTDII